MGDLDMIELTDDRILDIFFDSWKIPIGIFDGNGALTRLFSSGGKRQTELYLEDSHLILISERGGGDPVQRFDMKGSCWCVIPLNAADSVREQPDALPGGEDAAASAEGEAADSADSQEEETSASAAVRTLLLGPVQTGRNPAYPYEGVPEHTWNGFREIARCLISLLLGKEIPLIEKAGSYTEAHTAQHMYRAERIKNELNSFDEVYDCVRSGDLKQLNTVLGTEEYAAYQDRVMKDRNAARTVFFFHLAKTYHAAQESSSALQDLSPLVALFLSEEPKYRSVAAYKAGMQRILYDFTRYVSQYREGHHSPLVNRAQLYINENLYSPITVQEVAEYCMVSLSTLQHRFREETGMSVKDRIRRRKVSKACFFLKHTNLPCGDIAFRMGYGSRSYFAKQFKAVTGMTPQEYRMKSGSK